ncbi:MAG: hypothetical protein IJM58_05660 [Muribaculaceae bacterium]|nr:hypothetical protein [Muribaculaceae bacterium]
MRKIMSLLLMMTCCASMMLAQDVESWVSEMLTQYPKARILDIYKSCFQDYMGAEHLVGDSASARAYLEQELETTSLDELMPWYYEPCGINGNYVRVSLLAVMEGKVQAEKLLDAFVRSANDPERPTIETWKERWHEIVAVIDKMGLELPYQQEDKAFIEGVLAQGKYAISHSPDYREAYSPHYRIIKREIFENEFKPLLLETCCTQ